MWKTDLMSKLEMCAKSRRHTDTEEAKINKQSQKILKKEISYIILIALILMITLTIIIIIII